MSLYDNNEIYAVNNIVKRQLERLKDTTSRLGTRTGPNIIWLKENENDKVLRMPYKDFREGINTLSASLGDLAKGLAIIGGLPNQGKSTILTNMQSGSLRLNDDVMVLDFTLDDDFDKRFQQHVACLSGLTYQQITTKSNLTDAQVKAKDDAIDQIATWFKEDRIRFYEPIQQVYNGQGKLIDVNYRSLPNILTAISAARATYPERKIVVTIDAWNNIQLQAPSGNATEIATVNEQLGKFKAKIESLGVVVLVSAHLRKGTAGGEPSIEDLKGTSDLAYNNLWTGIVINAFKSGDDNPPMWEDENGRELPVIRIMVPKSKVSAWTYPLIYALDDSRCRLVPLSRLDYSHFYSEMFDKKKRNNGRLS